MKLAYADPPYLGKCGKFYQHNHPDGLCWDDLTTHKLLTERLERDYPDGWALSCSSPSLRDLLAFMPSDARIGAWVKPFCIFKKGVRPAYAWEPVIFRGGNNPPRVKHPPPLKGGRQTTPKDFIACPITLRRGLTGAKPAKVCEWILDLLGAGPDDEVADLYPGTGAFSRAAEARRKVAA